MNNTQLREQVDLIREVFMYTRKFRQATFVFKIDDSLIDDPAFPSLVKDIALLHHNGIRIALIPGAVNHIDKILSQYGIETKKVGGIRLTTAESLPFVKMAAFDLASRLMTWLAGHQINAVIGNWVRARAMGVIDGTDYQFSGHVDKLKTAAVKDILEDGDIPLFPSVGWNSLGEAYNISTDELAIVIARELSAAKLFFITALPDLTAENSVVPAGMETGDDGRIYRMTLADAEDFLKINRDSPITRVLDCAVRGCREGIERVHIVDGRIEGVLLKEIYSNTGSGLMIHSSGYDRIRPMAEGDIDAVLSLIRPFVEKKILIPRTRESLMEKLADYVVYEVDGILHACAAFHPYGTESGELAAVAVNEEYRIAGIGRKIVHYLIDQARRRGFVRIFALTTQTSDWFLQLGFRYGEKRDLPETKAKTLSPERNSRVLLMDL
jgi:amino-acid N-acetyltransferase